MDIMFHGRCMDGSYAALTFFCFLKALSDYSNTRPVDLFTQFLKSRVDSPDLLQFPQPINKNSIVCKQIPEPLPKLFFTEDKDYKFRATLPGEFTPTYVKAIKYPQRQIIVLLDCYGETLESVAEMARSYRYVLIIDHHTSFSATLAEARKHLKNIFWYFSEEMCGFELTLSFLEHYFDLKMLLPKKLYVELNEISRLVRKNDLKMEETVESKHFCLGFYHFKLQIQSGLIIPSVRTLAEMSLELILKVGKGLFGGYIQEIRDACQNVFQIEILPKKIRCLAVQLSRWEIASDLGTLLAAESTRRGFSNLCLLYRFDSKANAYRTSVRSHRKMKDPLALQIAQFFGGGGHLLASGCKIENKRFKKQVKQLRQGKLEVQNLQVLIFS